MWEVIKKQKTKHIPSGIIIAWLGNDNKAHTQSIPNRNTSIGLEQVKIDAKTELLLRQLDYLGGGIKSMPIITTGLTRAKAKQILLDDLQKETKHNIKFLSDI